MRPVRNLIIAALGAALLNLSACGTTNTDRVTGGAALGAATGAVIGALGGPVSVGAGALIGTAAGAGVGLLASPNKINLGRPPWHRFSEHLER